MARDQAALRVDHPWPKIAWISLAAILGLSFLLGFVVLSRYQTNGETLDFWSAICRGLGIASDGSPAGNPQPPLRTPTEIAWTRATLEQVRAGNAGRGEQVAMTCNACHGNAAAANSGGVFPTLNGMDAAALFKQLADYRSDKRLSDMMGPMAKAISVEDSANVAAYFASQRGGLQMSAGEPVTPGGRAFRQSDPATRLVFAGDPQRGIAPCSSCHGPGGHKTGVPPLAGQHAVYIERQLGSFAQGTRHNDIYEQMRAIARQLTPEEMHAVAEYYGKVNHKVAAKE
jgi:cytochrome c553